VAAGAGVLAQRGPATQEAAQAQIESPKSKDNQADRPRLVEEKKGRTDRYGDPLPPGALVRMGTVRLRQPHPHVQFSADGKSVISAGADNTLRTWDVGTGKYLSGNPLEARENLDLSSITLAPDGKVLAAWRWNRESITLHEVRTGKKLANTKVGNGQLYRLALAPGGKAMAAAMPDAGGGHSINLWLVATGTERTLMKHDRFDHAIAFSPDGKFLCAAGDSIRLWDVTTGKLLHNMRAQADCLIFSPDSKVVASGGAGIVKLWDVATGKEMAGPKATPTHDIQCLALSPDGKVLAVGGQSGLRLWDRTAGKEFRHLPDRTVYELAFAPDGKVLAASGGSNIDLWDLATGKQLLHRPGHNDEVESMAVSPDGKLLVSTSYSDGTLYFWDAATGKLLHQPPEPNIAGRNACLSSDGKLAASGFVDRALHLWDTATGKEQRRFPIEQLDQEDGGVFVDFLGLSPDGRRLVAVTRDGGWGRCQINIWDTATGKTLKRRRFEGDAFSRFTPDANGVTVTTRDTLAIHEAATGAIYDPVGGGGGAGRPMRVPVARFPSMPAVTSIE
jgi:WD40 repeat protein